MEEQMNLRDSVLTTDYAMRIVLAFYDFVHHNNDWCNCLENTVSDRLKVSDFDFEFDKRLYSFYYTYVNVNNIRCYVRQYRNFYDTAKNFDYLLFDYDLTKGLIVKIHKKGTVKLK